MKITVFCGSSMGNSPVYADAAKELGAAFAQQDIELVYGGGHVGLMGTIADAVLAAGGRVHGVIRSTCNPVSWRIGPDHAGCGGGHA